MREYNMENMEIESRRIMRDAFISFRAERYELDGEEEMITRVFLRVREISWDQLISISQEFYDHPGRIEILEQSRIQIFPRENQIEVIINDYS